MSSLSASSGLMPVSSSLPEFLWQRTVATGIALRDGCATGGAGLRLGVCMTALSPDTESKMARACCDFALSSVSWITLFG